MHPSSIDRSKPAAPRRRPALGWLVSGWLSFIAPAAHAQDAPAVEALIQEGIRLRRAGEDARALSVFRQAERLQPASVRVLLHLSTAAQAAGSWVEADTYIRRVSEYRDDPYYQRYREEIALVEQTIASRVGRFQAVGSPPGAEVRLDGRVIGRLPMAEAHRIEAGSYQLEIVSDGYYALRRTQQIRGAVLTRERVELARETTASAQGSDGQQRQWWAEPWVGWTLAGGSAAAALTASVAFVAREHSASRWNDDSRCVVAGGGTREQRCGGDYADARLAQSIGIGAGVTALILGGAAAAHFLSLSPDDAGPRPGTTRASSALEATCSPGWLGVSCEGRF